MAAGSGFKCHGFRQYDCKKDNRHGFDFLNVIFIRWENLKKSIRIHEGIPSRVLRSETLPLSDS